MRVALLGLVILSTAVAVRAEAQQLAQATGGAARAGTAAAVRGEVKLAAVPGLREVGKDVASGDPIFLGDQVSTGAEGRLQIMLADETVFTIGPNAAMTIDTFVYDPATSAGKVTASVLKGTFRFVTGKVAKREPSDMEVKLPVGSIGVRGTSVAGEVDGNRATIVLLGPGPETNSSERVGRVLVTGSGSTGAATTVEIIRPGYGTEIAGVNIPPIPALRIDPARIAAMTAPLAGTAPRSQAAPGAPQGQGQTSNGRAAMPVATGPSPLNQSGASVAKGTETIKVAHPAIPGGDNKRRPIDDPGKLQAEGIKAAQAAQALGINTTFEQLRSISAGTATFTSQTVALNGGPGTASYTINYSYNFGSRTANGSLSITANAGWGGTGTGSVALIANPFASGSGEVKLGETINVPGGPGGTVRIDYGFKNSNNVVFKALSHNVQYNQGGTYNSPTNTFTGGNTATGNGVTTRP